MDNQNDNENTPWRDEGAQKAKLGDDFRGEVMQRIKGRVALRDFLFMLLQGFSDVFIGLLRGIPKTESSDVPTEEKKQ